jgi:ATP-dependent DNA helicase RecG
MAFEIVDVGAQEIAAAIATEEGHFSDVKALEISPGNLTKTLAAFANADGGELFVGIDEDKTACTRAWRGFGTPEAANGHIQALEQTFPLDQFVEYQFLRDPAGQHPGLVLKAAIQKTPDVRRASNGKVYVRRGAQSIPYETPEQIQRLEYQKGIRSFETHPVDVPLDLVTDSVTVVGFMIEVVPNAEPAPWLRKQLLVREDKPTVAALLLFSDEPQVALPKQSSIKIYRYTGTDAVGTRAALHGQPITIEGNLYDQIHEAVRTTVQMIEGIRLIGPSGMEDVSYPEVALHEIITNAVIHRDYSVADDIHVRIFDNRIEVASPGRLPAHITPDNILQERFARNGSIVRWINKFSRSAEQGRRRGTADRLRRHAQLEAEAAGNFGNRPRALGPYPARAACDSRGDDPGVSRQQCRDLELRRSGTHRDWLGEHREADLQADDQGGRAGTHPRAFIERRGVSSAFEPRVCGRGARRQLNRARALRSAFDRDGELRSAPALAVGNESKARDRK